MMLTGHKKQGVQAVWKRLFLGIGVALGTLALIPATAFAQEQSAQDSDNTTTLHEGWIQHLLVNYYDPMYEYQLGRRDGKIIARGSRQEITEQARALLSAP